MLSLCSGKLGEIFPSWSPHKRYGKKLERYRTVLQSQSTSPTKRGRTIKNLGLFMLKHKGELRPQNKVTALECIHHIRSSDQTFPFRFSELVLLVLVGEQWTLWEHTHLTRVVHFLSNISRHHLPRSNVDCIMNPFLIYLDSLCYRNANSSEDNFHALRDLIRIVNIVPPRNLSKTTQLMLQARLSVLLSLIGIEKSSLKKAFEAFVNSEQWANQHVLSTAEQDSLRNGSLILSSFLDEDLHKLDSSESSELSSSDSSELDSSISWSEDDIPYFSFKRGLYEHAGAQECVDALSAYVSLCNPLQSLPSRVWSSFLGEVCCLGETLIKKGPHAGQCACALWGLSFFVHNRNATRGLTEENRVSLQKTLFALLAVLKEGNSHTKSYEVLQGLDRFVHSGLLRKISKEERIILWGAVCHLLDIVKNQDLQDLSAERRVAVLRILDRFANSDCLIEPEGMAGGLTRELKRIDLASLQESICVLISASTETKETRDPRGRSPHSVHRINLLETLGNFAECGLLEGLLEEQRHSLQKSICSLLSDLINSPYRALDCVHALISVGKHAVHGVLQGISWERRQSLQTSIVMLIFRLKNGDVCARDCACVFRALHQLVSHRCLAGVLLHHLPPLQDGIRGMLFYLPIKHLDAEQCIHVLEGLDELIRQSYLRFLSGKERQLLQEGALSALFTLTSKEPSVDQCFKALSCLGHLVKYHTLQHLPSEELSSLQGSVCTLVSSLDDSSLNARQCSNVLWNLSKLIGDNCLNVPGNSTILLQNTVCNLVFSFKDKISGVPDIVACLNMLSSLSCLDQHGFLENISEGNRHLLRESVCFAFSNLRAENLDVEESLEALQCVAHFSKSVCLREILLGKWHVLQEAIFGFISTAESTLDTLTTGKLINVLACLALCLEDNLLKASSLSPKDFSVLQSIICDLASVLSYRGEFTAEQCVSVSSSLSCFIRLGLFRGFPRGRRRVLLEIICVLVSSLKGKNPSAEECVKNFIFLGDFADVCSPKDFSEKDHHMLREVVCDLVLILRHERLTTQQCSTVFFVFSKLADRRFLGRAPGGNRHDLLVGISELVRSFKHREANPLECSNIIRGIHNLQKSGCWEGLPQEHQILIKEHAIKISGPPL